MGTEDSTVHLQCALYSKKLRFSTLKKLLPDCHIDGVVRDNGIFDYSSKESTRIEGPWSFGTPPKAVGRPILTADILNMNE